MKAPDPLMLNGLTEAQTDASASVQGLSTAVQVASRKAADFTMREVLSELIAIDTAVEHWIEDKQPRSQLLKAITDNIRQLLAATPSVAPIAVPVARVMGFDPFDPTRGAHLPMVPSSWRFGFWRANGGLEFHAETISEPGAALKVQVLHLTDAGRECLTLNWKLGAECECYRCLTERDAKDEAGWPITRTRMILCPTCGCKRCPHATDHRLACTDSNESGQPGSRFTRTPPPEAGEQKP